MASQFRVAEMHKEHNEKTTLFLASLGSSNQDVIFHKHILKHT